MNNIHHSTFNGGGKKKKKKKKAKKKKAKKKKAKKKGTSANGTNFIIEPIPQNQIEIIGYTNINLITLSNIINNHKENCIYIFPEKYDTQSAYKSLLDLIINEINQDINILCFLKNGINESILEKIKKYINEKIELKIIPTILFPSEKNNIKIINIDNPEEKLANSGIQNNFQSLLNALKLYKYSIKKMDSPKTNMKLIGIENLNIYNIQKYLNENKYSNFTYLLDSINVHSSYYKKYTVTLKHTFSEYENLETNIKNKIRIETSNDDIKYKDYYFTIFYNKFCRNNNPINIYFPILNNDINNPIYNSLINQNTEKEIQQIFSIIYSIIKESYIIESEIVVIPKIKINLIGFINNHEKVAVASINLQIDQLQEENIFIIPMYNTFNIELIIRNYRYYIIRPDDDIERLFDKISNYIGNIRKKDTYNFILPVINNKQHLLVSIQSYKNTNKEMSKVACIFNNLIDKLKKNYDVTYRVLQ